jgi:hypothetical protein
VEVEAPDEVDDDDAELVEAVELTVVLPEDTPPTVPIDGVVAVAVDAQV